MGQPPATADRQQLRGLLRQFLATGGEVRRELARVGERIRELGLDPVVTRRHEATVKAHARGRRKLGQVMRAVGRGAPGSVERALALLEQLRFQDEPPLLHGAPRHAMPHAMPMEIPPTLTRAEADGSRRDTAAAPSSLDPPGPDDLAETVDVRITPEILATASQLGSSPVALYEFVRNEIAFEPYAGSRKGSAETLAQRRGNDTDQASLLLALLRASGVPSRYVRGTAELAPERAMSWLGVDDALTAATILSTAGLDGVAVVRGPDVVAIRFSHVWVEAYVPYADYRGVAHDESGKLWVPLAPAVTGLDVIPGEDVLGAMGFDIDTFFDDYVSAFTAQSPLELLHQEVQAYLDANAPGTTVADVERRTAVAAARHGLLPGSLPFTVIGVSGRVAALEDTSRYRVRFHLHDGATDLIDHTVSLPEIVGRRVAIDYVGATPADQATIDAFGGLYETPPDLVELKPVLRLDDVALATATNAIGMGRSHAFDMHFLQPAGAPNTVPVVQNTTVAGNGQAIGFDTFLDAGGVALGSDLFPPSAFLAWVHQTVAVEYLSRVARGCEQARALMRVVTVHDVAEAIARSAIAVSWLGGVPVAFEWQGLQLDADRRPVGTFPVDGDAAKRRPFSLLVGMDASIQENRVFEDLLGHEAVSAMKILELASDAGVPLCEIATSIAGDCPAMTQPAHMVEAVNAELAAGRVVTIPQDPITVDLWSGTGYVAVDPLSGVGGYVISGGIGGGAQATAGGATVDAWTTNLVCQATHVDAEVTFPAADSPHPAAVVFADEMPLFFEITLTLTCVGGGTQTQFVSLRTRQTTAQLGPGTYELRLGGETVRRVSILQLTIGDVAAPEAGTRLLAAGSRIPLRFDGGGIVGVRVDYTVTRDGTQIASGSIAAGEAADVFLDQPGVVTLSYRAETGAGGLTGSSTFVVARIDLAIHKPAVIDPAEPAVTSPTDTDDTLEVTLGAQTFVNLDNDDRDERFDTGTTDTDIAGEDEMVKLVLTVAPRERLPRGVVRIRPVSGRRRIKVWTAAKKDTEYVLDSPLRVPDDFVPSADGKSLVKTLWVEGIAPDTTQRGTRLRMVYDRLPGAEDTVALTILGIRSIVWRGRGNALDDGADLDPDPNHRNPDGSALAPPAVRVFPDARAAGGTVEARPRQRVEAVVDLTVAPIEPVPLFFDAFDVDDPTRRTGPVDAEARAFDNRGGELRAGAGADTHVGGRLLVGDPRNPAATMEVTAVVPGPATLEVRVLADIPFRLRGPPGGPADVVGRITELAGGVFTLSAPPAAGHLGGTLEVAGVRMNVSAVAVDTSKVTVLPLEHIDVTVSPPAGGPAPVTGSLVGLAGTTFTLAPFGRLVGETNGILGRQFTTEEATLEFDATLQPGDNFRIVGNGDRDFVAGLVNDDGAQDVGANDGERNANKQRIVDPAVAPAGSVADREIREVHGSCVDSDCLGSGLECDVDTDCPVYASPVLTVWRFLHVEADSMAAPPAPGAGVTQSNFLDRRVARITGSAIRPGHVGGTLRVGASGGAMTVAAIEPSTSRVQVAALAAIPFTLRPPAGPAPPPDVAGNVTRIDGTTLTLSAAPAPGHAGGTIEVAGASMNVTAVDVGARTVTVAALGRIPVTIDAAAGGVPPTVTGNVTRLDGVVFTIAVTGGEVVAQRIHTTADIPAIQDTDGDGVADRPELSPVIPVGQGRFEAGEVVLGRMAAIRDLDGNGQLFVQRNEGIDIPFAVTGPAGPLVAASGMVIGTAGDVFTVRVTAGALAAGQMGGSIEVAGVVLEIAGVNPLANTVTVKPGWIIDVRLHDDDTDAVLPTPPDTGLMQASDGPGDNLYARAYIRPVYDEGGLPGANLLNIPPVLNTESPNVYRWDSRRNNSSRFWVAYILSALQDAFQDMRADRDPDREGRDPAVSCPEGTQGSSNNGPAAAGGSLIYRETIREIAPAAGGADFERRVVVHEVGHVMGLDHGNGMDQPLANGIMNTILSAHPFPMLEFIDNHLNALRGLSRPQS